MAFFTPKLGLGVLSGLTLVEPTAAEYQRQPFSYSLFPAGVGVNDAAADFGITASNWGPLRAWGMYDGAGNQVFSGSFAVYISGAVGNTITVLKGSIPLTFAPQASSPSDGMTLFGIFVGGGTYQGNATLLSALTCIISSAPAGSGFVLPDVAAGTSINVKNQDEQFSATIYPPSGSQFNSVGVNQPISVPSGVAINFVLFGPGQWYF